METQHQRHRTRRVRKVGSQLNIPTMSTPDFRYVFRFHCMCCVEGVSNLINHPVMCLFATRMNGTCTKVVTQRVNLELPATTTQSRRTVSVFLSLRRNDLYVRLTLKRMCLSLSVFLSEEGERLDLFKLETADEDGSWTIKDDQDATVLERHFVTIQKWETTQVGKCVVTHD